MTQKIDSAMGPPPVAPLRMRRPDGNLYCRPKEVEGLLEVLSRLPERELVERARVKDAEDPCYVPSECVLYFVRRPSGNGELLFREMFAILRERILAAVPVPPQRIAGSGKLAESSIDLEIREAVLHKFHVLLCTDRRGYEERLDFYECRFNAAIASLRATARRDVRKAASRQESLDSETGPTEPSPEVESALARVRFPAAEGGQDFLFRSKLLRAISVLPADERRVVELLLEGLPIDSKDEETLTVAKVLGCTEKTVRNRRDRAFPKLRDALKEKEDT